MKKAGKAKSEKGADDSKEAAQPASPRCTVVGFGASAGGLEPVPDVLTHLPRVCGLALVFTQPLAPKHGSMLTDLLGRSTQMPVFQVKDGIKLEANKVYVIPPNRSEEYTSELQSHSFI